MWAARWGSTDIVQSLLEMGADINAKNEVYIQAYPSHHIVACLTLPSQCNGNTALIEASEGGYLSVVKLLVEWGAVMDAVNKVLCLS